MTITENILYITIFTTFGVVPAYILSLLVANLINSKTKNKKV